MASDADGKSSECSERRYGLLYFVLVNLSAVSLVVITCLSFLACTKTHCSLTELPANIPKTWSEIFSRETFEVYVAWIAFQFAINSLPVGKITTLNIDGNTLPYRFNGMFVLGVTLAVLAGLQCMKLSPAYIYTNYVKLMTSSIIFSFLLSFFLYIKSFFVNKSQINPEGNTVCWPTNFVIGREMNPRVGRIFDFKVFAFRNVLISWIAVLIGFACHEFTTHVDNINKSLLVSYGCQIIYLVLVLHDEDMFLTMHSMKKGFGFDYAFVSFTMFPFVYCLQALYVINYRPVVPIWRLIFSAVLFAVGNFIMLGSNLQKHRFRCNPYDPTVAHLETIPTNKGKKLLVSGWWGWVCHPNYLGEIMVNFSFALPAGFNHGFPLLLPTFSSVFLVYLAYKDDRNCRKKYGSSWDRYRERVKYRLVPYLY